MWKKIIILTVLLIPAYTNAGLGDGLVGYWPLDYRDNAWKGTASTSEDRSGNNNKVLILSTAKTAEVKAKRDGGIQMNGVGNILRIPHSANYSFGTGNFTISYWVNRQQNTSAFDNIWGVTKWVSGSDANNEWYTGFGTTTNTSEPAFGVRSSGGTQYTIWHNTTPTLNTWYYFTAVRDDRYMKIYWNGVLATSSMLLPASTSINAPATPNNVHLGYSTGSSLFTAATFDDLRIYNRALSGDEIRMLYWNGVTFNYWKRIKNNF